MTEGRNVRIRSAEEAHRFVNGRQLDYVKVGVTDIDGILRGKYLSREKFLSAMEKGFGFCDVIVGWDSNDQLYDNVSFTGWHTAYPDVARAHPARYRPADAVRGRHAVLPLRTRRRGGGDLPARAAPPASSRAPRTWASMSRRPSSTSSSCSTRRRESVRAKGYRDLKPMTPGFFGYSVLRSSVHAEFYRELLQTCRDMDMPIEGLHTETGPGVLEAAIGVDEALNAADKAVLFKTFTKVIAQRRGLMATFMAKWSKDWPGQSGHIHLSLKDRDRRTRLPRRLGGARDEHDACATSSADSSS